MFSISICQSVNITQDQINEPMAMKFTIWLKQYHKRIFIFKYQKYFGIKLNHNIQKCFVAQLLEEHRFQHLTKVKREMKASTMYEKGYFADGRK